MARKKKVYDPKKCQHRIVAQFEDCFGNKVSLLAHHAFKWSICKDANGCVSMTLMPRKEARREYERLKKLSA
jgi:hypothetical protein